MALKYGLPDRLYNALVGTLRGDSANFGAKVDFTTFIEASNEIGFRTDDKRSSTDVVVLSAPARFAENPQTIQIARPSSPDEWPAAEQAIVAQHLEQKYGLVPDSFIRFNGALAYGSAIFVESDD
ncbi:hypothetical protein PYCCODRAFT_1471587 [Trametes coccinea BRFM310]|uniref:Uncharacterized protein n=1 Tax=Trametes coccinea (strain BRFM310) TaxID=1353009 RepID=A0A1Y2I9P4_TRAC3|nr:hypothetical protein PYCCODRAFT_1471587 [Trametes coccinea BRFM310]